MGQVKGKRYQSKSTPSAPVPLTIDHDTSMFDCGEATLNDWLNQRALKNESKFSRAYVVCVADRVVAYYCIAAGAVERSQVPKNMHRNTPNSIPISVIGRLAVDREFHRQGLGADMLSDAFRRIAVASQTIGIGAVLIHAKNEEAKQFYLRCAEFIEYPNQSLTLFLPIETLISAFS